MRRPRSRAFEGLGLRHGLDNGVNRSYIVQEIAIHSSDTPTPELSPTHRLCSLSDVRF